MSRYGSPLAALRGAMVFCLAASVLCATGCGAGPKRRNTFQAAVDKLATGGFVVLEQGTAGDSGYAILGDAAPPHSKVAFALVAVCHDDFYLGSDKDVDVWGSPFVYDFAVESAALTGTGFRIDRGLRPNTPLEALWKTWQPKLDAYLAAGHLTLPDAEKEKMRGMLTAVPRG
jgi:hypothetical protein